MVRIRVLGAFEAEVAGVRAALGGPRQRAVLALLVAARGEVVPVDRMIEDLWRGEPPAQAVTSLQAYVSNLRRLLEPGRPPRAPARVLVSAAPGYALRLPEEAVDAWRFAALARDPERAAEALVLWRGPAFAEFADEDWARAEIGYLNELRLAARERHVAALLRAGDAAAAVPEAELLTRDEPLREEGWRLLALALWGSGRQADALAALREVRATLAGELGLDPSPALADLETAILQQRTDAFDLPAPAPVPVPAPAPGGPAFLGRDEELAALTGLAAEGGVRVALVTGEAGLGKTALLTRLADVLEQQGRLVVTGRCPESESAPPAWAWTEALTALDRHVPAPAEAAPLLRDASAGDPGDTTAGRFRLHRAVWAWLNDAARRRPLAVMLDDLHWADAETLALLAALSGDAPLLVVAAFRADEAGTRLTETLAVLARRSPLRLPLSGLPEPAVARLIAAECGDGVDAATVSALAERTGGNPFYVRESARLLSGEGALVATSQVPEGVRDVLRRRLARLPEPAVAVLRLAALAGREADMDALVLAADAGEDAVLDALDAGLVAGLLTERDPGRVRFAHALVRETMVADLSALRRTRMHARLGAALERLAPDDAPALAYHFHRAASAATAAKAVEYAVRAADLAERRYAHETAVELLTQALESFERLPGRDAADRVDLLGRLLRAQARAGAVQDARATRRRAVDLAEEAGRDDLLLAAFTAWTEPAPWQLRPYGVVDGHLVGLLSRLLERDGLAPDVRCRLLDAYAAELTGTGDARGRAAAEEAVEIARSLGDPKLRVLTLFTLAREHDDRKTDRLAAHARELRALGTEHDMPAALWSGTFNLAAAAVWEERPAEVRARIAEAADLARRYRMPEAGVVCEVAEAALALTEARPDDAERHYAAATRAMADQGSLHTTGFALIARAALAVSRGTLAGFADEAGTLAPEMTPLAADVLAAAHAAAGRFDEARRLHASAPPIQPDYFFTMFCTFRAMTVVALGDERGAAELYEALLPYRDGPPAGLESLAVALPPPARTLGRLARLVGADPSPHERRAAELAALWNAPHWAPAG
ncbi:BTAD domain-containing putative transcriptional regulator [Actinomadura opuntiae]|uniref:BTAD domain-containing putative transcriptional regulator n=1 Tax=Actinomadura sp. OS1-43 TaxID=604315 RepID=UPI00255A859A|nr:BTAD domain-containing putative transcriptional regulator [Actinomadura sp. OS1-43]MDL4813307.1 BTAD domain-containing putative transcriptional regulator [Actinomadura sp. OS1-43]